MVQGNGLPDSQGIFRHQCRDQIFLSKLLRDLREGTVIFGIYQRNFGKLILRQALAAAHTQQVIK